MRLCDTDFISTSISNIENVEGLQLPAKRDSIVLSA